jgi:hypothetical protein
MLKWPNSSGILSLMFPRKDLQPLRLVWNINFMLYMADVGAKSLLYPSSFLFVIDSTLGCVVIKKRNHLLQFP